MKRHATRTYVIAAALFVATVVSTHYVGIDHVLGRAPRTPLEWLSGARFALPLLAILVAHESGHYFAAMRRGVRASPPMFIPVPFALLGTMGAVIGLSRVKRRDAMLEIGAAGPIAGLVVALPVLAYGLSRSVIGDVPTTPYLLEGRSLLYLAFVRVFAGPIGPGEDVLLAPEAFAGWAGLLVTMANLVPIGTLDGGHVARALLGAAHGPLERRVHRFLLLVGLVVSSVLGIDAAMYGAGPGEVFDAASGGFGWLVWAGMIALISRMAAAEPDHVVVRARSKRDVRRRRRGRRQSGRGMPSRAAAVYAARKVRLRARLVAAPLPRWHRVVAIATLLCFPLLFMPFWLRFIRP